MEVSPKKLFIMTALQFPVILLFLVVTLSLPATDGLVNYVVKRLQAA